MAGTVFCGEAGSARRREYTLAGARVNLSARLMQYAAKTGGADGGVVVDESIRAAVLEQVRCMQSACNQHAIGMQSACNRHAIRAAVLEQAKGRSDTTHSCDFDALEPIHVKVKPPCNHHRVTTAA